MKMRNLVAATTLALLLAAPVAAQQNTPTPADTQPSVRTVTYDGYEYDIGPDEPLVSYVVERTEYLDRRTTVRIVTFIVLDSGAIVTVPPYETLATGPLAEAKVGDALALEPVR